MYVQSNLIMSEEDKTYLQMPCKLAEIDSGKILKKNPQTIYLFLKKVFVLLHATLHRLKRYHSQEIQGIIFTTHHVNHDYPVFYQTEQHQ